MSDYHHLKPGTWKKRVSTCEFSRPHANGHGRSVSRFTVISNAAETETETLQSYDPYRSSRVLQRCNSQASHAKITIHRDHHSANGNHTSHMRSASSTRRVGATSRASNAGRPASSRGSMTSLHSNRQGAPRARGPSLRHKRGVDFSQIRKRSGSHGPSRQSVNRVGSVSKVVDHPVPREHPSRSQSPELPMQANGTYPKAKGAPTRSVNDPETMFTEELRHFSNNIAKDCDEAFKSSLIEDDSASDSYNRRQRGSPFTFSLESTPEVSPVTEISSVKHWDSRPLPSEEALHNPSLNSAESITPSIYDADDKRAVEQVARLAVPVIFSKQGDRRVLSAPVQTHSSKKPGGMPSINEDKAVDAVSSDKGRIVSAPPHTPPKKGSGQALGMEYLNKVENTIRVVHSPTAPNPVKIPKPLKVRKKTVAEDVGTEHAAEVDDACQKVSPRDSNGGMKKKSWFKRSSKATTDSGASTADSQDQATLIGSDTGPDGDAKYTGAVATRKKSFNFPFWKNKGSELKMSIAGEFRRRAHVGQLLTCTDGPDDMHDGFEMAKKPPSRKGASWRDSNATDGSRNIEVKQNWLARLFRVKPATSYLCMSMSRKRARQEVAILLREWRRYGIRGIQVDRQRNIIFARVGARNCE